MPPPQMVEEVDKLAVLRRRPGWDKKAAAAMLEVRGWVCGWQLLTRDPALHWRCDVGTGVDGRLAAR